MHQTDQKIAEHKLVVKKRLSRFRMIFFREKYRFDQGNAFLVFVNFALLVTSLVNQSGGSKDQARYYVVVGLLGTWLLGYILDRVIKVQDAQEKVALKRSPIWRENFDRHDNLNNKIDALNKKMERLEVLMMARNNKDQLGNKPDVDLDYQPVSEL